MMLYSLLNFINETEKILIILTSLVISKEHETSQNIEQYLRLVLNTFIKSKSQKSQI